MRIGSLSNIVLLTDEADKQFKRISKLIRELGTGRKADLYEDSPSAVTDALTMKFQKAQYEKYEDTIKLAKGYLLTIDDILGKVYDVAVAVKDKLVQAANSRSDYTTLQEELKEYKNRLLQYARTKVGDKYLFAGNNYTNDPYSDTTTYTYQGGPDFNVKIAQNDTSPMFIDGSTVFGSGSTSIFAFIDDMVANITDHQKVEDGIQQIEDYLKQIDAVRAKVGLNEQKLESYSETYSQIIDNLKKRYNDTTAVDMDKAISDYHLANTTYKALLAMLAKENMRSSNLLKYF